MGFQKNRTHTHTKYKSTKVKWMSHVKHGFSKKQHTHPKKYKVTK